VLRTTLDKAYLKRTIRPLYGWTQATPKSCFLDPAWDRSVNIWPGMVMARTSGENYTLVGAGMQPSGLCGLFIGGDGIDEVRDQGVNALAVWVLGPDAEMEILSPGFDSVGTPTAATTTGLRGQLVPAGTAGSTLTATPVARLLKVLSPTKIIVGGLRGTV
jgi:hypothetical protein